MEETKTVYCKRKDYLVCADSDGSVMDTMNSKHQKCFGPCLLRIWDFGSLNQKALKRWDELNLFSGTRGVNRYLSLVMLLEEMESCGAVINGLQALKRWTNSTRELSNKSLEWEIQSKKDSLNAQELEGMNHALQWSILVNQEISRLTKEDRKVFQGAVSCLKTISRQADLAVVSSANPEALEEEWTEADLADTAGILMSQKDGTKAQCIGWLLRQGYEKGNVMMVGDAPGDVRAAAAHGVWFYPILAGKEEESWRRLEEEIFQRLISGTFDHNLQNELYQMFCSNLKMDMADLLK